MAQSSKPTLRASGIGLLAGLVGSLCCLGSSAALLLGLGGSSALLGFTLDARLALAGAVVLLLAGCALAFRQARACALRPAIRWRAPALMLLTFALSYGLLGWLLPALAADREDHATAAVVPAAAPARAASLRRVTLLIEKMNCPPCAATVRTALKRQPDVRAFVAETNNELVTIDYDSARVTPQQLAALFPQRYHAALQGDQALP